MGTSFRKLKEYTEMDETDHYPDDYNPNDYRDDNTSVPIPGIDSSYDDKTFRGEEEW